MLNKIILTFGLVFSQASLALLGLDDFPKFPILQKVGDFDPSSLQKFYNKFTDAEPDYAREDRMIAEIEDAVMDGDVEYLPLKGDKEVFSIYMEPDVDKPKGGVIILHSRGYHANWSSTIKPLRVGLAEKGWHTLSVQMPVLEKSAKYYDYVSVFPYSHERIDAALSFYKQRGVDNVILVSHGCGAHMSMSYFDKYGDEKINAYVGIGMGATDYKQKVIKRFPLDIMLKPVLDVYGENDFPGVIRLSESRQNLMDVAANTKSAQMVIKGADHYYKENGTAQVLTNTIDAWLSGLR
jgi:pimeloyl-ACP methyl ester carboxylesterase